MRPGMITLALAAATIAPLSAHAQAQSAAISYNIPAGNLKSALDAYSRQSGRPIIYRGEQLRGIRSRGYRGRAQADEALNKLLAGTGFIARRRGGIRCDRACGRQSAERRVRYHRSGEAGLKRK